MPDDPKINPPKKITDEMVSAGVAAFERCEGCFPPHLMVEQVYIAMMAAADRSQMADGPLPAESELLSRRGSLD